MNRFAQAVAFVLLAATALAGCSGGATGLLTGATAAPAADAPGTISNEEPLARPIAVAWTSARAQRCGFFFDPAKLRTSYLAFEATQSAAEQLAKAEKTYDTTFTVIRKRVSSEPDYCSDRKSAEIKADLSRHLAGDYTPRLPQPKKVESCGFFGCGDGSSEKPFKAEDYFEAQRRNEGYGR